ncbi:MAG: ABC transporter ATP-binding protein [Lachnospiraceae bacterium]|nr:ABC transporter ATP-binding protein [Lachnospiraceae bacterium]
MKKMVVINGLSKAYKDNILFRDMDFDVTKGGIYGIIGKNGSGKSVLLKMICGLVLPDDGTIEVDGSAVEDGRFPQNIGVILDCAGFLPQHSGIENLSIIAKVRNKIGKKELEDVMRKVGLDPALKVKVGKYSLGMKQRLALAQAIMEKPDLLILDEPMNAIDAETVVEMRQLLKKLNIEDGVTILMTSHNHEDIEELCTDVYEIADGNLCVKNTTTGNNI